MCWSHLPSLLCFPLIPWLSGYRLLSDHGFPCSSHASAVSRVCHRCSVPWWIPESLSCSFLAFLHASIAVRGLILCTAWASLWCHCRHRSNSRPDPVHGHSKVYLQLCIYSWDLVIAPAVATHSCPLGDSLCTHCSDLSSPSACSLYTYFKSPRLFLSSLRYSCFSRTYWLLIFATKGSGFPSSSWRKLQAC